MATNKIITIEESFLKDFEYYLNYYLDQGYEILKIDTNIKAEYGDDRYVAILQKKERPVVVPVGSGVILSDVNESRLWANLYLIAVIILTAAFGLSLYFKY